jgi:hypothetical protein
VQSADCANEAVANPSAPTGAREMKQIPHEGITQKFQLTGIFVFVLPMLFCLKL